MDNEIKPNGKLLNFLLVEDNDDHAELIRQGLRQRRMSNRFDRASNGQEGLDMLRANREKPVSEQIDIVLLDINMPVKGGLEVLEEIKEDIDLRSIPVVMLTTSASEKDRLLAYRHRANSYLVKPVDFQQFLAMIEDLGLYWGVWNWGPNK